jgi:hypothetical protein
VHYHPGKANIVADVLTRKAHSNYLLVVPLTREPWPGCGRQDADMGTYVRGDLDLGVDRRGTRFAVAHANMLKDIPSVLALVLEEVIESLLY